MSVSNQVAEYLISEHLKRDIAERKMFAFMYKGTARVVQPYMLGKTEKQGLVFHAYQVRELVPVTGVGMVPNTKDDSGWRFFYVNKVEAHYSLEAFDFLKTMKWQDPPDLSKTEYQKPKFVTEILALSPRNA